jgi:hypothetical protein
MSLTAPILALGLALFSAHGAAAPWRVAPAGPPAQASRTLVETARGDRLAVYRDADGRVIAEFAAAGPSPFARSACPSVQVDDHRPPFSFTAGVSCTIEANVARFELARITGTRLESALLYHLMNGNAVAFRYTTADRAYREAVFPLTQSKKALLRVLGRNLDVQAPVTE